MRFYVASRFLNHAKVRDVVDHLTLVLNHSIPYDWTRTPQFDGSGTLIRPESTLTPKERADYAYADFHAACEADAVVMLCQPDMAGSFIEVGLALAHGAQIYVVGSCRFTIFWALPNVRVFNTVEDFYMYLDAFGA